MICQSCSKQKAELFPRKSLLLNKTTLLLCQTCIDYGFEPRYLIVLFGRSRGIDSVREFIVKRRYIGADITALELTH